MINIRYWLRDKKSENDWQLGPIATDVNLISGMWSAAGDIHVQMRVLWGKPVYLCLLYWPGNTTVSWESHDNCDIDLLVSATTTLQSKITPMLMMIQQMKWFKWNMSPTRLRDSIFPNCSPYLTFIGPNER